MEPYLPTITNIADKQRAVAIMDEHHVARAHVVGGWLRAIKRQPLAKFHPSSRAATCKFDIGDAVSVVLCE
jgi:hypothetical protein